MSTKFSMTRDINGFNGFGLPFAEDNKSTSLVVGVPQSVEVPSNHADWIAIFSYTSGSSVWVANNTTATAAGAAFADTASSLNPVARKVKGGDVLSFLASSVPAEVGVEFLIVE